LSVLDFTKFENLLLDLFPLKDFFLPFNAYSKILSYFELLSYLSAIISPSLIPHLHLAQFVLHLLNCLDMNQLTILMFVLQIIDNSLQLLSLKAVALYHFQNFMSDFS